jgi:hypothetical protein
MDKKFVDVPVGGRFIIGGVEFIKTESVRVSCCQSVNAQAVDNSNNRPFIQDETIVIVNA